MKIQGWNLSPSDARADALPWPLSLNTVTVKAGLSDVRILFAGRGQINVQLPFGISGDFTLEVVAPGGKAPVMVRILPVAPSFLSLTVNGESLPAVTHLNGAPISAASPAVPGEWLTAWMTGLGPVDPPVAAGQAAASVPLSRATLPVRVVLGEVETAVSYAGLAPGLAGIYQVNFVAPAGIRGQTLRVYAGAASAVETIHVR